MLLEIDVHHELCSIGDADDIAGFANAELRAHEGHDQAGQTCGGQSKLSHFKPFDN